MYMYDRAVELVSVSTIFRLYFATVLTVWCVFVFYLYYKKTLQGYLIMCKLFFSNWGRRVSSNSALAEA
jgi:hypothetical protein